MKSVRHVDESVGVATSVPMAWERFGRLFTEA
jgi:hypothetical protein